MIDPLDSLLRDLIQSRIPALAGPTQLGFVPPNVDWRSSVFAASEDRLNIYLYDVRENLALRSNERLRTQHNGWTREQLASPRADCSYLLTAWSAIATTAIIDPTSDEHRLLYSVLAVLMRFRPLAAAEVYSRPIPSGGTLAAVPGPLKEQPLPLQVALPDAVKEPTEFWTTMRVDWRPALHVTVTIPVVLDEPDFESPMVTTLTGLYGQSSVAVSAETVVTVGGAVSTGAPATPVAGAWVQIRGVAPPILVGLRRHMVSGADGRFVFSGLRPGDYQLRVVKAGLGDVTRPVTVPSPSGEYDVHLP